MVCLAKAMIAMGEYKNGILIDYSPLCCNYFTMSNTVAPQMGDFIANSIILMGLNPGQVDIVGHSLGAHIGGYAGASLKERNLGLLNKIFGEFN